MTGLNLQLDPSLLDPIIRRVVAEIIAQLNQDESALGEKLCHSEREAAHRVLLLRSKEAAKALAISERKLWELTRRGAIPHVQIDRSVRYDVRDLQAWVDTQRTHGTEKEEPYGQYQP